MGARARWRDHERRGRWQEEQRGLLPPDETAERLADFVCGLHDRYRKGDGFRETAARALDGFRGGLVPPGQGYREDAFFAIILWLLGDADQVADLVRKAVARTRYDHGPGAQERADAVAAGEAEADELETERAGIVDLLADLGFTVAHTQREQAKRATEHAREREEERRAEYQRQKREHLDRLHAQGRL